MSSLSNRIGGMRTSLAIKAPVRCATTSNIALTGFQTIDGVTLAAGDTNLRVLVMNQTDASENGIYDVKATAWTRAKDFNGSDDVVSGTVVLVAGGTYQDTWFQVATNDPITIGTTDLSFVSLEIRNSYRTTDVAAAATTDIGATATTLVQITGTGGPITSLGSVAERMRVVWFTGVTTLVHNATSLILPDGQNITTAAGDAGIFESDSSGNWRCILFTPRAASETVSGRLKLSTQTQAYVGTDDATAITPLKLATKLPTLFATTFGVLTTNTAGINTFAMNAAISALNILGGVLLLPQGTTAVNQLNSITANGATIEGQGMYAGGSVLSFANATGDCITLSGANHCQIRNVWITASVRRTANFAIKVTGSCFMPVIENVRIDYHFNGIWVHTASQAKIDHVHCRYMLGTKDLYTGGTSGDVFGLGVSGFSSDNPVPTGVFGAVKTWATGLGVSTNEITSVNGKIYQCSFGGTTAGAGTGPSGIPGTGTSDAFSTEITDGTAKWKFVCDATLVGVYIDSYSYSIGLTDTQLVGGNIGVVMDDTVAAGASYPLWVDTSQVDVDHSYAMNVALLGGESYTALDDWYGSSLQSYGVYIGPSFRGEATLCAGTRISGCWLDGVYISSGPVNTNVDSCKIYLNSIFGSGSASGIKVAAGASYFKLTNNTIGKGPQGTGYQKYGIEVAVGASDHYVIVGNMLHGNATGPISDGGSGTDKRVHHNPPAFDPITYVGDANFSLSLSSSNPIIGLDANDYVLYDRTGNTLSTVIGGSTVHQIGAAATYMPGIELGHASDTTITRSAAGLPAVEGVTIALNSTSRAHTAQSIAIGDANFSALLSGGNPIVGFDANDYMIYDRTANALSLVVGAATALSMDANGINLASGKVLKVNSTQVVGARDTGWTAMTGSPNKATAYDTSTVTLPQLAGRVAQLQASLTTHGLIGV